MTPFRVGRLKPSFYALFAAAFIIGAALRLGPQVVSATHPQASSASAPTYEVINNGDESPAPQDAAARAVVGFYRGVINGDFDTSYGTSLENRWQDTPGSAPRVTGLQTHRSFTAALNEEVGSEGMPVGIMRLAVDWERPFHPSATAVRDYPELLTLRFLPHGTRVSAIRLAHVSGHLVGNCQIAGFARTDVVAQVNGRWKVLLPGRKRAGDPHFEEWFLPHTHFHATFRQTGL